MSVPPVLTLDVDAVCKSFGGIQALTDVSFEVRGGEILGLIGPNGAGKSVLINVVSGIYPPDSGTLRFRGSDITRLSSHMLGRLGIARTFQNIRLFRRMTVLENVLVAEKRHLLRPFSSVLGFGTRRAEIEAAMAGLARMHLADRAEQLAGTLAYGDARRLEIARALAGEPRLLFLDEPAAGMNERETEALKEDIARVRGAVDAIVIVEHDMELLRGLASRMVALDYGRKIAEGTPQEVLSNPQVVETYLGGARHA
ncbi:MAG TPA: ABC transporter ATP-binding protein [Stellaceae bacterium]|nr:ABC transporter ATP-binding protein [Stellaceae bacterium]